MAAKRITPDAAVRLLHTETPKTIDAMNSFSRTAFRTRGGRLGSGMGSLLEALWVYFMNQSLLNEGGIAADCEIAWLEKNEPNDFACVLRDAAWVSKSRAGELFRIEAKSMNAGMKEPKAHFTELFRKIKNHDQLLVLVWRWTDVDAWRKWPRVVDHLIRPARPIATLRDVLHRARDGSFVEGGACPDGCTSNPCRHTDEPLNADGKRERKGGPDSRRPSAKVSFANNYGGLVRMLKTDNADARRVFRRSRKSDPIAHDYISFIHHNFPREEVNQYTLREWRAVAAAAGLDDGGSNAAQIASALRATAPGYRELLRDLFHDS